MNPLYQQYGNRAVSPSANYLQNAMNQAAQIMRSIQNPQQFALNCFGNIPPEIQNDPDQILNYLKQNNRLTPQQLQLLSMLNK